jgi:hypothetical protein
LGLKRSMVAAVSVSGPSGKLVVSPEPGMVDSATENVAGVPERYHPEPLVCEYEDWTESWYQCPMDIGVFDDPNCSRGLSKEDRLIGDTKGRVRTSFAPKSKIEFSSVRTTEASATVPISVEL